jgi:hypothetical protein
METVMGRRRRTEPVLGGAKQCRKCLQIRPLDEFCRNGRRHATHPYCRACRTRDPELAALKRDAPKGSRVCSVCRKAKPLGQFWVDRKSAAGYQPRCKVCSAATGAERRRTAEFREWLKVYRNRPEVKAQRKADVEANWEKVREIQRRYRRTPRGKLLAARNSARYRLADAEANGQKERSAAARKVIEACERELRRLETTDARGL